MMAASRLPHRGLRREAPLLRIYRNRPLLPITDTIDDLVTDAVERTHALILVAEGHFKMKLPFPEIRFDLRGKAAGQLRTHPNRPPRIRYNPAILIRHPEDFLAQTVPHETAHLAAYRLYGNRIKPHGHEWQHVMSVFGARPERCHNFDVDGLGARRMTRFNYHCQCQTHRLTSIRHGRIQEGQIYRCRGCGGDLRSGAHPSKA